MESGISPSGPTSLFFANPYRYRRPLILVLASLSVLLGIILYSRHLTVHTIEFENTGSPPDVQTSKQSSETAAPDGNAIAIFLGTEPDAAEDDEESADHYYIGARTLVYQLLHAPRTKLTSPIAVVVLTAEGVQERKMQQLRDDGAMVVDAEKMEHSIDIEVPGYHQVFDKLRVFDPTAMPFNKVALLDADMVITRPLDAIFQDINATSFPVIEDPTAPLASGLPELPEDYTLAATPDIPTREPVFPPTEDRDYFNAGVIVLSPSEKIFQFYLGLLAQPDLFGHWLPEQDLLNYAHRWDGPMPWREIDPSWHLIWPTEADFNAGMAILHCKYWQPDADPCHQTALARRWEMEGYWEGRGLWDA